MNHLSRLLKKQIQVGHWPGFIVGMYPSQYAYEPISVDFDQAWRQEKDVNLYYHIPFCKWNCTFCTFFKVVKNDRDYFERYIDKVNEQLMFYSDRFGQTVNVKSICFGGGTPNAIPIRLYGSVFETLRQANLTFDRDLEPSMEISPETITEEDISMLAELGVKRLSMGVQSLREELRRSVGRAKNLNVINVIDAVRKYNLNMNIDLINGLKGQDGETFMETLERVVDIAPETISIYLLSGANTSLFKQQPGLMTTREKYELFEQYYDFLLDRGYRCESHVKFVREGTTSTHQQKIYEYQGIATLGLGCGARSYNSQVHYSLPWVSTGSHALIDDYINLDFKDLPWTGFYMNEAENKRRFIIYSFFVGELSMRIYRERFGSEFSADFAQELEALDDNQLIFSSGDLVKLTPKGVRYTDLIGTLFWSKDIWALFNRQRDAMK